MRRNQFRRKAESSNVHQAKLERENHMALFRRWHSGRCRLGPTNGRFRIVVAAVSATLNSSKSIAQASNAILKYHVQAQSRLLSFFLSALRSSAWVF